MDKENHLTCHELARARFGNSFILLQDGDARFEVGSMILFVFGVEYNIVEID